PLIAANIDAAGAVRDRGGTVSFDPNLRKEILDAPGLKEATERIIELTTLFLPSGDELMLFASGASEDDAIRMLLGRGVSAIVHKMGRDGARYIDAAADIRVPAFSAKEVDPTGAGDCFGATFTALWLRGEDPREALTQAAAAGAIAVTARGPMEGVSTPADVHRFIADQTNMP
ncbi:MAG: PfkB family carbohydrate kinase, partial [Pseudomonadota bacterium]